MRHKIFHHGLGADLEFYRSGFPLASLDRVRPAARSGTQPTVRLVGRLAGFLGRAATGTGAER